MKNSYWVVSVVLLGVSCCFIQVVDSSPGDSDPLYKTCVEQCKNTGCVGENCFQHCRFSSDGVSADGKWYMQEPLYLRWKQWDCQSDCRYHCMLDREQERENLGKAPVKYHGKWPFKRVFGIQAFLLLRENSETIKLSSVYSGALKEKKHLTNMRRGSYRKD
ncbi:hypothetical protein C5167_049810 [Papaver somniferum]|uniref:Post-GPI attachment to proteins factor 3 n=1 Tax=Papaver somniferum TaxID=3469 RepID=A0A4Y7KN93_PAPSO|nr:hypothetical protein C5167_049810 [Papaver somniferum]